MSFVRSRPRDQQNGAADISTKNGLVSFDAADEATRQAILRCVDLGELEIYANNEMLVEVMGMAGRESEPKIIRFSGYIL